MGNPDEVGENILPSYLAPAHRLHIPQKRVVIYLNKKLMGTFNFIGRSLMDTPPHSILHFSNMKTVRPGKFHQQKWSFFEHTFFKKSKGELIKAFSG